MATIKAFIRSSSTKDARIRLCLSDGRKVRYLGLTDIWVNPAAWDAKKESIKPRFLLPENFSRVEFDRQIAEAKNRVMDFYSSHTGELSSDWITDFLRKSPEPRTANEETPPTFNDLYNKYLSEVKVTPARMKHKVVTGHILERYQLIKGEPLDPETIDSSTISEIEAFIRDEHQIQGLYPSLYSKVQKPRGQNTINDKLKMLFAFLHWLADTRRIKNRAFDEYEMEEDVYGDPIPLLSEEVEHLRTVKLPKQYTLSRDLFCLQCYTGCRVSDFMQLSKANVQDGFIIYVAEKTIKKNPTTVYVPLIQEAMEIVDRYGYPDGRLMPYLNVDGHKGYNKQIKELCSLAGLTRSVIVIDPVSRKPEPKRLCDVVSTHTARKTFINTNYKATQDPKLISKMTGHSENSRAFSRYRNIDLDMLKAQMEKSFGR